VGCIREKPYSYFHGAVLAKASSLFALLKAPETSFLLSTDIKLESTSDNNGVDGKSFMVIAQSLVILSD